MQELNISNYFRIFEKAIDDYHVHDKIDREFTPIEADDFHKLLHYKAWIDTVQWHCEDEVRNPSIAAEQVRTLKNKIDALNQERTNLVEKIDDYFLERFQSIVKKPLARLNTESPAWALDRLSILALKLFHMQIESQRSDIDSEKRIAYQSKYNLLLEQKSDLIQAIHQLLNEIERGETIFKLYRQVKMYNDADLNPVLRNAK